jgi:hypothetical protein
VITCRSCYLRLPITKEIKTYGELREATTWFKIKQVKKSRCRSDNGSYAIP